MKNTEITNSIICLLMTALLVIFTTDFLLQLIAQLFNVDIFNRVSSLNEFLVEPMKSSPETN